MAIPDEVTSGLVTGVSKPLLDVGVVGAVCILLIVALCLVAWYFRGELKSQKDYFTAELEKADKIADDERAKHDVTRAALLEEVRSNRESYSLFREQMQAQAASFDMLLKVIPKVTA